MKLSILSNWTLILESKTYGYIFPSYRVLREKEQVQKLCKRFNLEADNVKYFNFFNLKNYPVSIICQKAKIILII